MEWTKLLDTPDSLPDKVGPFTTGANYPLRVSKVDNGVAVKVQEPANKGVIFTHEEIKALYDFSSSFSVPEAWHEGMTTGEEVNLAYWERNMMVMWFAVYSNKSLEAFNLYRGAITGKELREPTLLSGWFEHQGEGFEGWSRVISLFGGKATFHVPDSFPISDKLPKIEPNWDGHTTEEKWNHVKERLGLE